MKLSFSFIFFLILIIPNGFSQDIHFSQYYNSPLSLNPANTGNIEGDFRLMSNYRDQWSSISNLYKTIFASFDISVLKKNKKENYLGAGVSFYNDKAGKSKTGTLQGNISLAYNLKVNKHNFFSAGLQLGYAQRGNNLRNLKWDNQFNGGTYNSSLPTGENNLGEQVTYLDLSTGLLWKFVLDKENKISIGASGFHLNRPNQSFSQADPDPLNPKFVLHINSSIKLRERNIYVLPFLLFSNQGTSGEINIGSLVKYGVGLDSRYTGANKSSYISFGSSYRMKDALVVLLNLEYKNNCTFGFSYDINFSKLSTVSRGNGALELSIIYSGLFLKE